MKICMKLYLNDEKTKKDILWVLKNPEELISTAKLALLEGNWSGLPELKSANSLTYTIVVDCQAFAKNLGVFRGSPFIHQLA